MSARHEGPGHGEATLSLTEVRPDGSRVTQSWTICDCTLPALRERWGPPAWESIADEATTRRIAEAARQPGNIIYSPPGGE
jgi:hypothetical protein